MGHYFNRGIAYYEQKEYELAISDYDKFIELNPNYADAYFGRGLAYADLGQVYADKGMYERSIADFSKAIELTPNNDKSTVVRYAYLRGIIYRDIGEKEKAIADFEYCLNFLESDSVWRKNIEKWLDELLDGEPPNSRDSVWQAMACLTTETIYKATPENILEMLQEHFSEDEIAAWLENVLLIGRAFQIALDSGRLDDL